MQIWINGGAGSTSTNQKPTYGQGYFGDWEECGCKSGLVGMQEVLPLTRNSLMAKGILGIKKSVGAGLD